MAPSALHKRQSIQWPRIQQGHFQGHVFNMNLGWVRLCRNLHNSIEIQMHSLKDTGKIHENEQKEKKDVY